MINMKANPWSNLEKDWVGVFEIIFVFNIEYCFLWLIFNIDIVINLDPTFFKTIVTFNVASSLWKYII